MQRSKDRMKGIEHLKDGAGHMLFDCDAGAKRLSPRRGLEKDRRQISPVRTVVQRRANLTHHRDIKNVQRRTREGNSRHAIFNLEFDVLKFHRWIMNFEIRNLNQTPAFRELIANLA